MRLWESKKDNLRPEKNKGWRAFREIENGHDRVNLWLVGGYESVEQLDLFPADGTTGCSRPMGGFRRENSIEVVRDLPECLMLASHRNTIQLKADVEALRSRWWREFRAEAHSDSELMNLVHSPLEPFPC